MHLLLIYFSGDLTYRADVILAVLVVNIVTCALYCQYDRYDVSVIQIKTFKK